MTSPRAAKGPFPYLNHRTAAEINAAGWRGALAELDALSRQRALTERESIRLQRLLERHA